MIKKLLATLGLSWLTAASSAAELPAGPYKDDSANFIYQLLFCDRVALFKAHYKGDLTEPWASLFRATPDLSEISRIAADPNQESRIRMLAYSLLRQANQEVPKKVLLGTIIEVHLADGLDTLAIYLDGRVRYINHSGKMVIIEESSNLLQKEIEAIIAASKPIVSTIGPWDKERLTAPKKGNLRMTFLVSDGLYFGEGSMTEIQQDKMAYPLIQSASTLLAKLVDMTLGKEPPAGANGLAPDNRSQR